MDEIKYDNTIRETHTDEQLKEMGWKHCTKCNVLKEQKEFYKSARKNGLSYTCRQCHRKIIRGYRNVEGSYNYSYRRMEKQRTKAKRRGIEYALTTADYQALKDTEECYYCKDIMDVVTIDRIDNNKGYTVENAVACCYLCNKIKNVYPFNLKEMEWIGKAVKSMTQRQKKLALTTPVDNPLVLNQEV